MAQESVQNTEQRQGGRRFSSSHYSWLLTTWIGVLGLLALRVLATPDPRGFGTHESLGLPACMLKRFVGVPCPGCGVTTSATLVAHGRPWDSLVNQPFGFLLAVSVPLLAVGLAIAHLRGKDVGTLGSTRGMRLGATVLVLVAAGTWVWKLAQV